MMAENPTNIKDKNERRDVRRNTSNQIVSYTLPNNSVQQYGLVKLPAITSQLNRVQFEKTINTKIEDLLTESPNTNIEIVTFNNVLFPQTPIINITSRLESLRKKYNSRYAMDFDTNNGRFELSVGYQNNYYPAKLPFNTVISGAPQNSEPGAFAITEELKNSGFDLILKYRVTAEYRGGATVGSGFATMFDFDNFDGIESPKLPSNSKYPNIEYQYKTIPARGGSGNNLVFNRSVNSGEYRVTNSELRIFDRWQVKCTAGNPQTFAIADGSYFDIEVVEPN
jgi:hypothetical protein